jgi:hypothetical protein
MGLGAGCMFASMRFFANGPSIPDELLVSRDEGDVIFSFAVPEFLKRKPVCRISKV